MAFWKQKGTGMNEIQSAWGWNCSHFVYYHHYQRRDYDCVTSFCFYAIIFTSRMPWIETLVNQVDITFLLDRKDTRVLDFLNKVPLLAVVIKFRQTKIIEKKGKMRETRKRGYSEGRYPSTLSPWNFITSYLSHYSSAAGYEFSKLIFYATSLPAISLFAS